jgi:broad specificity phosphatase PhoE
MSRLILVRHSISKPQAHQSAHTWNLTDAGRLLCARLADKLRPFPITQVMSSDEPKAIDTARSLMVHLDMEASTVSVDSGLCETARSTAPYFEDVAEFKRAIQSAMDAPDELRFGEETFYDALSRFRHTVDAIVKQAPDETIVLVSHGTILSLYLSHVSGLSAYTLWELLDMPAYAVLTLPDMRLAELCFSLVD